LIGLPVKNATSDPIAPRATMNQLLSPPTGIAIAAVWIIVTMPIMIAQTFVILSIVVRNMILSFLV